MPREVTRGGAVTFPIVGSEAIMVGELTLGLDVVLNSDLAGRTVPMPLRSVE